MIRNQIKYKCIYHKPYTISHNIVYCCFDDITSTSPSIIASTISLIIASATNPINLLYHYFDNIDSIVYHSFDNKS